MNEIETPNLIKTDSVTYDCACCGATLEYKPGSKGLHCKYCNTEVSIEATCPSTVEELDFYLHAANYEEINGTETKIINCLKCGSESIFDENIRSTKCPYCNTAIIEDNVLKKRLLRPSYILPFSKSDSDVKVAFSTWIKSLWFAPNKLKREALNSDNIHGVYLPCWTYDAQTETDYTGLRGRTYTTTVGSGKNKSTVTRTSWTPTWGHISLFFNDILVCASKRINQSLLDEIGSKGWGSYQLIEMDNKFLSGFTTEKYTTTLQQGYDIALAKMENEIKQAIRNDIGGDSQKILTSTTQYNDVTFKLILLPVYISSYRYRGRIYNFHSNGITGHIKGDRPYSPWKIAGTVTIALALITWLLYSSGQL